MVELDEWNVSRCVSRHKKAQFWPATRVNAHATTCGGYDGNGCKAEDFNTPAQEVSRLSLIPGPVD
jgi:hypothetical protein